MNSEQIITSCIGQPCKNIKLNMININSDMEEGTTEKSQPSCNQFIEMASKFFPTIVKNFKEELKNKHTAMSEVADRFFIPFWFSPSSFKTRQHPIDFGGDHSSETLYKSLGLYATHQIFAIWNNTNLCAALASKKKYDAVGVSIPKLMVPEEGYTAKEVEYCIERGICNKIGVLTQDSCRWVATYKTDDGKYNVSLICGDQNFISGSGAIFKTLFEHIEILKKSQENKRFSGITLPDYGINTTNQKDSNKSSGVVISRLLGGSIFLHDYLCILRDIFGVKKLVEFDISSKEETKAVSINSIIDDYAKVKKYLAVAKALKIIR